MPGGIPSVTQGKSPAADFAAALMSGHPAAVDMADDLLKGNVGRRQREPEEEFSLADLFVAQTHTLPKRLGLRAHEAKLIEPVLQSYRRDMRMAHRFVLDTDFVRYATAVSSTMNPQKLLSRLQFATLPYDIVWIEFDLKTKVEVMRDLHHMDNSKFNWDEVADRLGLIIRRLSDTEAVVEIVCETHGDYGLIGTTICYFMSVREYQWTMEDGRGTGCQPFLYNENDSSKIAANHMLGAASLWGFSKHGRSTVIEKFEQMRELVMPEVLLRHGCLGTGRMRKIMEQMVSLAGQETITGTIANLMINETTEFTGMARWIAVILAMLNEVPIDTHHHAPTGTMRHGLTGHRPLMDYHKVVLRVPKERPLQFIERQFKTATRRRAHEVRAHWRTYTYENNCLKDHSWQFDYEEGFAVCGKCAAFRRLIHEHIRGDASLGWVHRTGYVVKPSKQV